MTPIHDDEGTERGEVRDVFERLLLDEPPLAAERSTAVSIASAGRGRTRRRRAGIAATVVAAAGLAATLVVAGPGLSGGSEATDRPDPGRSAPVDPVDPVDPADPSAYPLPDLMLTDAGERRIAEEMVRRLEEVYPGSAVTWERVWPSGVPREQPDPVGGVADPAWQPPTATEQPQTSLRFRVEGQPGYVELESRWGLFDTSLLVTCSSWQPCPADLDPGRSVIYSGPDDQTGSWAYDFSQSASSLLVRGTVEALSSQEAAAALVAGDELLVRRSDLAEPREPDDTYPGPTARQVADIERLRTGSARWADDLGLGTPEPVFSGVLAPTRQPYGGVEITLPATSADDQDVVVAFSLTGSPGVPRDDESCGAPPYTDACRAYPQADGTVLTMQVEDGLRVVFIRASDGLMATWLTAELPAGMTEADFAAYVGQVGVPLAQG